MEHRSRASHEQFVELLEFMESHGDIARPQQGSQGRLKADRLWKDLEALLNSHGGGGVKSIDKWRKVWADWKSKTKKKALAMRRETSGTGGGPSSRQTLNDLEERVLGVIGLAAVVGQAGIEERGFDEPTSGTNNQTTMDSPQMDFFSIAPEEIILDAMPINYSLQGTPSSTAPSRPPLSVELLSRPPPPVSTPPLGPASVPMQSATSPIVSTPRWGSQRQQCPASRSPVASPTTSTPRRRWLLRERTRRAQTPFERATSEFVAVEQRRLQLEEDREKNNHQREMERLRLESRRITMEENRNHVLNRLADVLENLSEILPQLRPSSLPSTDILPT